MKAGDLCLRRLDDAPVPEQRCHELLHANMPGELPAFWCSAGHWWDENHQRIDYPDIEADPIEEVCVAGHVLGPVVWFGGLLAAAGAALLAWWRRRGR